MPRLDVIRSDLVAIRRFWRKVTPPDPQPPCPPPLPEGRIVNLVGRGETLIREIPGPTDRPALLLLHGWTLSADLNWFTVYDTLAAHGRVVALDQRGHGRGLRSEQPFTLEAAADDAAALVRQLGTAPAIVVGYSMGGSVGLLMWHRHPDTVAGLVLQSTGLQWRASTWERMLWTGMATVEYGLRFGPPRGLTERYLRAAVEQRADLEPWLPWLKAEVRRGSPPAIAAAGRALSTFDARSFARLIDVPTIAVVSVHDRLIRADRQRDLSRVIPGAGTVELEAAHNAWMVDPEKVSAALDEGVDAVVTRLCTDGRVPASPARS